MGYSSELTKERILNSAREEFLKNGFQETNLKDICKTSGVTTGAIYRHFGSKDGLFLALVKDVYDYSFSTFLSKEEYTQEEVQDILDGKAQRCELKDIMAFSDYIYTNWTEFKLLITKSAGSSVENFKEELVDDYTIQSMIFFKAVNKYGFTEFMPSELEVHMLGSGLISAILECITQDIQQEDATRYLGRIIAFYNFGWSGLLGIDIGMKNRNTPIINL